MTLSLDAFPYTGSMEDMSCPRLLIGTWLVTGTRFLSVKFALTPGLYAGPGVYAGQSFTANVNDKGETITQRTAVGVRLPLTSL